MIYRENSKKLNIYMNTKQKIGLDSVNTLQMQNEKMLKGLYVYLHLFLPLSFSLPFSSFREEEDTQGQNTT